MVGAGRRGRGGAASTAEVLPEGTVGLKLLPLRLVPSPPLLCDRRLLLRHGHVLGGLGGACCGDGEEAGEGVAVRCGWRWRWRCGWRSRWRRRWRWRLRGGLRGGAGEQLKGGLGAARGGRRLGGPAEVEQVVHRARGECFTMLHGPAI